MTCRVRTRMIVPPFLVSGLCPFVVLFFHLFILKFLYAPKLSNGLGYVHDTVPVNLKSHFSRISAKQLTFFAEKQCEKDRTVRYFSEEFLRVSPRI